MATRKQKAQRRAAYYRKTQRECPPRRTCPNCGEGIHDGHFVPPSFGEPGFFICEKQRRDNI